jgi:hypothetical protein
MNAWAKDLDPEGKSGVSYSLVSKGTIPNGLTDSLYRRSIFSLH